MYSEIVVCLKMIPYGIYYQRWNKKRDDPILIVFVNNTHAKNGKSYAMECPLVLSRLFHLLNFVHKLFIINEVEFFLSVNILFRWGLILEF